LAYSLGVITRYNFQRTVGVTIEYTRLDFHHVPIQDMLLPDLRNGLDKQWNSPMQPVPQTACNYNAARCLAHAST
jgi:hypothetical protein